jgi:predicted ester cyclase
MDYKQLAQVVMIDSFNDRSYRQKAKDLADANFVIIDTPTGMQLTGPAGFVQYTDGFVGAMPDLTGTLIEHTVNGNKVTTRVRGQGTFTGTLQTPQGNVPGNGKKLDLEYQAEQEYNDAGKLVRAVFSYDMQKFAQQLGLG